MNKLGWKAITLSEAEYEIEVENKCPCCSKQLVEGCCLECGEVYSD